MTGWRQSVQAYADAAAWFLETAGEVGDRWEQPGLGEWDIRALVGHTSRSFVTVESYLAQTPDRVEIDSAASYYLVAREVAGPSVAHRGIEAGRALGDDPVAALHEMADRVLTLVDGCSGEELLTSIVGGMRLADYLPTRTFEIAVHTTDLAAALGCPAEVPASAAAETLAVLGQVAAADGTAGDVLLALTGRRPLPDRFSLL
ncbi:maleylpyruvate isomerase N-terminal domain-containing protein [Nocardioides sp.]|uniref:maleylpyruvate isomerase N-terminal domain-containing protein n=1 Tax=Nocardioides sp. TaxID=35761 RepID=UPI003528A1FA